MKWIRPHREHLNIHLQRGHAGRAAWSRDSFIRASHKTDGDLLNLVSKTQISLFFHHFTIWRRKPLFRCVAPVNPTHGWSDNMPGWLLSVYLSSYEFMSTHAMVHLFINCWIKMCVGCCQILVCWKQKWLMLRLACVRHQGVVSNTQLHSVKMRRFCAYELFLALTS